MERDSSTRLLLRNRNWQLLRTKTGFIQKPPRLPLSSTWSLFSQQMWMDLTTPHKWKKNYPVEGQNLWNARQTDALHTLKSLPGRRIYFSLSEMRSSLVWTDGRWCCASWRRCCCCGCCCCCCSARGRNKCAITNPIRTQTVQKQQHSREVLPCV